GAARAGRAEWQVRRTRSLGVELALLDKVRAIPGAIAAPVIQSSATMVAPARTGLLLFGVDLHSDALLRLYRGAAAGPADAASVLLTLATPDALLLPRPFAAQFGIARGSKVTLDTKGGRAVFTVTALLEPTGPAGALAGGLGVIGLGPAQELLRKPGWVDRIDVAGCSREALEAACPGCTVEPAQQPDTLVEDAVARL